MSLLCEDSSTKKIHVLEISSKSYDSKPNNRWKIMYIYPIQEKARLEDISYKIAANTSINISGYSYGINKGFGYDIPLLLKVTVGTDGKKTLEIAWPGPPAGFTFIPEPNPNDNSNIANYIRGLINLVYTTTGNNTALNPQASSTANPDAYPGISISGGKINIPNNVVSTSNLTEIDTLIKLIPGVIPTSLGVEGGVSYPITTSPGTALGLGHENETKYLIILNLDNDKKIYLTEESNNNGFIYKIVLPDNVGPYSILGNNNPTIPIPYLDYTYIFRWDETSRILNIEIYYKSYSNTNKLLVSTINATQLTTVFINPII